MIWFENEGHLLYRQRSSEYAGLSQVEALKTVTYPSDCQMDRDLYRQFSEDQDFLRTGFLVHHLVLGLQEAVLEAVWHAQDLQRISNM